MFRKLLMCCPLSEGLHNRSSRFGTSSRSWITQHEQHLADLRIERRNPSNGRRGQGYCLSLFVSLVPLFQHAGSAYSAILYHHWRGFDRLALFIYIDDFIIPYRLALVGDFLLTRRVTVPLTHEQ